MNKPLNDLNALNHLNETYSLICDENQFFVPLIYKSDLNSSAKIGVWYITEKEEYFLGKVTLHREITHWHKRLQHLAGRLLLKELFPDFPVELILVATTRKPYLAEDPFHFSISHCGDYVAVIVSRYKRVGVDIELIKGKALALMNKFLTDEEILHLNAENNKEVATLCWCVKESIFKWQGKGGVDFRGDIDIHKITGENEGIAKCQFRGVPLEVQFLRFNDNFLCWIVTG